MPVPNPSYWVFDLGGTGTERIRVGIFRDDGTRDWSADSPFMWDVNHPTDTIVVGDANSWFDPKSWGETGFEELDSDGDMVPVSWDFGMLDALTFKGAINGSDIGMQDLRSLNTSRLAWLFNDPLAVYWVAKFQIDSSGSYKTNPVYYSGSVDYSRINQDGFFLRGGINTDQTILALWLLKTTTFNDKLKNHFVEELITGVNPSQIKSFPISGFAQSDMVVSTTSGGDRLTFFGGFVVEQGNDIGFNPAINTNNPLSTIAAPQFRMAAYNDDPQVFDITSSGFTDSTRPKNPYGVNFGFQGLSYTKAINKIAQIGMFTFSSSDVENVTSVYTPTLASPSGVDLWGLSIIGDLHITDFLKINYNVRFGVNPMQYVYTESFAFTHNVTSQCQNDAQAGILEQRSITNVTNASPAVFTTSTKHNLTVGTPVLVIPSTGNNFPTSRALVNLWGAAGTAYARKVGIIIDDFNFTLVDGSGTAINGNSGFTTGDLWYAGQGIFKLEQPCGYQWSMSLAAVLKDFATRFRCSIIWKYNQSGTHFGKPKLTLKRVGKSDGTAPSTLQNAVHQQNPKILNTNFSKTCVHVKHRGSDAGVYCPQKPKAGQDVIEIEVGGQSKKYGEPSGYLPADFINDTNTDVNNQWDTVYYFQEGNPQGQMFLTPRGWTLGACDFYEFTSDPNLYNFGNYDKTIVGSNGSRIGTHTDKTGCYAITYEEYNGTIERPDGTTYVSGGNITSPTDSRMSSELCTTALLYANAFLLNKTEYEYVLDTIMDDSGTIQGLFQRHKFTVRDEFGNTGYKRTSKIYIHELANRCRIRVVDTVVDESVIKLLPIIIEKGGIGSSIGGQPIGGGSNGGGNTGGGSITDYVATDPNSETRNDVSFPVTVSNAKSILHLNGALDIPLQSITIGTTNNNLPITDSNNNQFSFGLLTGASGASTISGIQAARDGCFLILKNDTAFECTLQNQNGSSSAANRIIVTSYANVIGTIQSKGFALLTYHGGSVNRWEIINIFPIPAPSYNGTYFTIGQNSDGTPTVTLNATWLATLGVGFVLTAPLSNSDNTIQSANADVRSITAKQHASDSTDNDKIQVQSSGGSAYAGIRAGGVIHGYGYEFTEVTESLVSGNNNNVPILAVGRGTPGCIRFVLSGGAGVITLTGIVAPTASVSPYVWIYNDTGQILNISANDANSSAANRITFANGTALTGMSAAFLFYSQAKSKWMVLYATV